MKPCLKKAAAAALGLCLFAIAQTSFAQNCRIHVDTGKCVFIPQGERTMPDFSVGDTFPIYEHNMLLDIDRYGLPPVDGAWRYYKSGYDIYRVDSNDYTVLEIIRNARIR